VYAQNAPTRLPFQELVFGVGMKACHVFQFVLRLAFVLSVWLMIIPFITYWIWRLTFVRSLGEAQRLFLSHISAQLILSDCLHGFLLSAIIVLIFLGATSLRDYIRHLRELGGHEADRDDAGRERHGARAVRRLAGPNNRVPGADGNIDELAEAQGIGAGELLRRNAENVAARLERLEAQVEQMLDGLDDADGAEDVPFDELVGMQGPVFHLVENAITVRISYFFFVKQMCFI
jgi:E3 ubiquitin-protein ligase MARCH6